MRLKWIDICDRFVPLLINLIYIILLSFNIKIDGFNVLVNSNYFIATYIYISLIITNYLISIILHKKYYFKNRSFLFILILILGLSLSPKIGGYAYFHTFIFLFSIFDVLLLLGKMVYDSYYTEERLKNLVLPPNQFNTSRKIISQILNTSGFILFFIICLIVFYYNEVKVTSILILLLVGLVIISIIQIISMSVSISPLKKYVKSYEKTLNIEQLEKSFILLKDEKLHKETINLMNIYLWKYYTFIDIKEADKYKEIIFKPSYDNINKVYYDAYFYYLLGTNKYDMILTNEHIFIKNVNNKKYVKAIIKVLHNESYKYKVKNNKFDNILNNIYLDLSSKLLDFKDYNYIKFNKEELLNIYNDILNVLSDYYTIEQFKLTLDKYNTINNKVIGATKLANIKLFNDNNYYNEYIYNINLLYDVYPIIIKINNLILSSRFKDKATSYYGTYYLKHLEGLLDVDDYDDIKEDIMMVETICYDNNLNKIDKITKLIELRNKVSKFYDYNSYLDVLYNNSNLEFIDNIDINTFNDEYIINTNNNISKIKDKNYIAYLVYLKKHNLYNIGNNLLNYTYYINNYRSPFISLNSNNLDYNQVYFELGKGYCYYLNNQAYIPNYLLNLMGYINVILVTNNLDYIKYQYKYYYDLYKNYDKLYIDNEISDKYYDEIILDTNPVDKLLALFILLKLYEGNYNLNKVFISLNRNLYKTSEKEIFSSFNLLDIYEQYINKTTEC